MADSAFPASERGARRQGAGRSASSDAIPASRAARIGTRRRLRFEAVDRLAVRIGLPGGIGCAHARSIACIRCSISASQRRSLNSTALRCASAWRSAAGRIRRRHRRPSDERRNHQDVLVLDSGRVPRGAESRSTRQDADTSSRGPGTVSQSLPMTATGQHRFRVPAG